VISKELERVGIPTAQISTMTPIALMVGSNRVIPGFGIIHPASDASLEPDEERRSRRALLEKALEALRTELEDQKLFDRPM
jgi:glycine/betaine/sarcosine/D-proline reductase family selenoprotein B